MPIDDTDLALRQLGDWFQRGQMSEDEIVEGVVKAGAMHWVLAFRILRRREDAEDALQDALTGFILALRDGRVIRNPKAFVARSVINRAITIARSRRRELPLEIDSATDPLTPELLAYYREVREALECLPADTSQLVIAQAIDGLTARQTAVELGRSHQSVRSAYYRGRLKLKEKLSGSDRPRPT